MADNYPGCRPFIREAFVKKGFPEEAIASIVASVADSTLKQYDTWFKKWWGFCCDINHDKWSYDLTTFIKFLSIQVDNSNSYSSINACKSALSFVLPIDTRDEGIIKRYLKGIYNQRPPRPKYNTTWDPHPVLSLLENMFPLSTLSLEKLSHKLVTLLAIITAHRVQTFSKIRLSYINQFDDRIEILIPDTVKTSGKNKFQPVLKLPFFRDKPGLCLASTVLFYLNTTKSLRADNNDYLILTHRKPYHTATSQTISRWIRSTLKSAGVDTSKFSGHSTRHASTSAAYRGGVNIEEIRKYAGWTEKSNVFNKFYNKPISTPADLFAKGVLQGSSITC